MSKKIIAFSSTHGTGKSSLAYMLAAKMKLAGLNVIVLDELARKCPFKINKDADERTQVWIICKQIVEELELMDKVDYLIVDRGVLDGYFYDLVVNQERTMCDDLVNYMIAHIRKYYLKIYVPDKDSFNYQIADGVRDLEEEFRTKVYDTAIELYYKFSIPGQLPYKIIHRPEDVYEDLNEEWDLTLL